VIVDIKEVVGDEVIADIYIGPAVPVEIGDTGCMPPSFDQDASFL